MNIKEQASKFIEEIRLELVNNGFEVEVRLGEVDKEDEFDADIRYEILTKHHKYRIAYTEKAKNIQGRNLILDVYWKLDNTVL